jgi:hypothetical protein
LSQETHFELFARKSSASDWALELATEDREKALETAEEFMKSGRAVAVKVCREVLDTETGQYRSAVILTRGAEIKIKKAALLEERAPLCVAPGDLYSGHARERIGRLLDNWLHRRKATPFELLHRPDLVEELEASGTDLRQAVQKIAVPEAGHSGKSVHDAMKVFNGLAERAIERLVKDARKGAFADLKRERFSAAADRLVGDPDAAYKLGGGVAAAIGHALTWRDKVGAILDLVDDAPASGPGRALAFKVAAQPLAEILASRGGLSDLVGGGELDLGASLAALTRMAAGPEVAVLARIDPNVRKQLPELTGPARRLADWLNREGFEEARSAVARRVLDELNSPKRLRPSSAEGEILILRALAMALTAAAGKVVDPEQVHQAFIERSRALVGADFVESYLGRDRTGAEEVRALVWLSENVAGGANKRAVARYLAACLSGLKFEREFREGGGPAGPRLMDLAELQKLLGKAGLAEPDRLPLQQLLGELGGQIEAETDWVKAIVGSTEEPLKKLTRLLRMATGETAPKGRAADRARYAALRLAQDPKLRESLAVSPYAGEALRELMASLSPAA